MKLNETLLMAWVDGTLPERDAAEVERLVAQSAEAQELVEALAASRLPYAEAFAREALPELPATLVANIRLLTAPAVSDTAPVAPPTPVRSSRTSRRPAAWLAVAFVAGVLCTLGGSRFWPLDKAPVWVTAVAQYQEMYVRATLENIRDNPTESAHTLKQVRDLDHVAINIPDLRQASYEFKRVQRLRYDGKPIVQLVYLPPHGEPIALCATPDARDDAPLKQRMHEDLGVVSWRANKVSYVLVGRADPQALQALGQQLQQGKLPTLYS